MFSLAIVLVVLGYTWLLAPIAPRWVAAAPVIVVVALAVWRAIRTGEWGLARSEFLPALGWAAAFTGVGALAMYLTGTHLGTWHTRADPWGTLGVLIPWALGQQFALHTVLLREAQSATSKSIGILLAALLFAALHLPNPFLTPLTCIGALAWCWMYLRHPNLVPLALSHAMLTLVILFAFDDGITGRLRVGAAFIR
jgi:membrane protease YdiL (CAAX protease family)